MELKEKASQLDAEITAQKEALRQLTGRRDSIQPNTPLHEIDALIRNIKAHENKLEQLQLLRMAVEKKVSEYANNEPRAAQIRKRLTEEFWPRMLAEYGNLKQVHDQLASSLEKVTALNNEGTRLADEHNRLTDDSILNPAISIPGEVLGGANVKLRALPQSIDVRPASQREQERLADLFKKQRPAVSKILARCNSAWPICPKCGTELLAHDWDMNEDESRGFAYFRCPKHSEQDKRIVFPLRQPDRNVDPVGYLAWLKQSQGHGPTPGQGKEQNGGGDTT